MNISLRRSQGQTVKASSNKKNYVNILSEIINLKGHLNCFIGSKVTAILVNGRILPSGFIGKGLRLQPAQQACSLINAC